VEVEIYKVKEAEEAGVEESELDAPVELCGKQKIRAGCGTPLSAQVDKY
jgi:hypothetical protein